MNPLSEPHSVPLAEGICRAVSDMNADRVMVTQETLMEQLVKKYPGIAVPSHNTLYNILGTLIKERKIYHTGEGYFIVTPNTYFISNDVAEDNRRVPLEDCCCCSSPSITYLVTVQCCADLLKENIPVVSHCRSCRCFPEKNMLCEQRHRRLMSCEPDGGGKKGCSELKSSIRTQGISTFAENHSWDTIKSLTSVKEKLKSKRFGLGPFWRSAFKKEKLKKEYSTFSAQFPPKEWPVRDEDDFDNIPRHIEHEIIKRINPTLTVDNLIKHTKLMQKFEEQKKYISKGTSAEVSIVRQNHLSKDCNQKTQSKRVKHTQQLKSKKEEQMRKSHVHELTSQNEKLEENLSLPIKDQQPSEVAVESRAIYKKQIKNPFQGLSRRQNFYARGYKGIVNSQLKSRARRQERALQRPRSLHSSNPFDYEPEQLASETQAAKTEHNKLLHANRSSLQQAKDSLSENCSYPRGSTLQIDNKSKYFLESFISEENTYRTVKKNPWVIKKSPHSYTEDKGVCQEDAKFSLHLKDEHCKCQADRVHELLDQTANDFQNVCLSNDTANIKLLKKKDMKYRQKTEKKSEFIFKYDCARQDGSLKLESEEFTDNCQKAQVGDTCSSLHPDDNVEGNEPCHLPPGRASSDPRGWSKGVRKLGTVMSLKTRHVNTYPARCDTNVNKCHFGEHGCKESAAFVESTDSSKEHLKRDSPADGCLCSQALPTGHKKEETNLTDCVKASAAADFCRANKAGSDADTLQNFTYEIGGVEACSALGSQAKEMRNLLGKKDLFCKSTGTVVSGQKHTEGTENHSITGDSGIDSPRWTEKKMKLPDKF